MDRGDGEGARPDGRSNQEEKRDNRRKNDTRDRHKEARELNPSKDAKDEHRRKRKVSKEKERGGSKSGSESGEDVEERRERRKRRKKRKERSVSGSESESEDSEERERRKRRREKRRKGKDESEGEDSEELDRRERKKEKRRRRDEKKTRKAKNKRSRADSESGGEEKRKLLREAKKFLKKHSKKQGQELVLSAVARKVLQAKLGGGTARNVLGSPDSRCSIPFFHRALEDMGSCKSAPAVDPITSGDYFQKNAEFATWLREGKGIFFSDLSSDQARSLFDSFVEIYNEGKLPDKYYDGITSTHAQRTSFSWAIKGRGDTGEDIMAEEDRRASEVARSKSERKKWKQDQELLLDEMLPKASGREANLEKKAVRREQQRGREDSPELMRDKDLLGGGDDFQQRLAREKDRREKRFAAKAEAVAQKTTAYQAAENAKLDQFRALLGASGGKISIPKRAD